MFLIKIILTFATIFNVNMIKIITYKYSKIRPIRFKQNLNIYFKNKQPFRFILKYTCFSYKNIFSPGISFNFNVLTVPYNIYTSVSFKQCHLCKSF